MVSVPSSSTTKRSCGPVVSVSFDCSADQVLAWPRDHTMTGVGAPSARQVKFTARPTAALTTDDDASTIDGGSAASTHPTKVLYRSSSP